jgi:hypothetical protein
VSRRAGTDPLENNLTGELRISVCGAFSFRWRSAVKSRNGIRENRGEAEPKAGTEATWRSDVDPAVVRKAFVS